jgi:protein ImuB
VFACIHANGIAGSGIASEFSPRVEEIDGATVVLDIAGMERLFGSPRRIAELIAAKAGPHANVAVASNRSAAVHAARGYPGIVVIPPGEEAARLSGLPVTLLATSEEVLETLAHWGIGTFGDLAALPETGLAERFGQEGVRLRKLARGEGSAPLWPDREATQWMERIEIEHPLELLEPLSFLLSSLLHKLCERLAERALALIELRLALGLEGGGTHERRMRLPVPMRNPAAFLKLLMLDLDAHPPGAPVVSVTLAAEPAKPRALQEGLFLPPAPEPEKLELTLKRLRAVVGEDNVGSPELVDTHRPGAFRVVQPFAVAKLTLTPAPASLAMRRFRPPVAAQVSPAGGAPERLRAGKPGGDRIEGSVIAAAGPWRTSGDWWTASPWARDDWDLALTDGGLYRVYREFFSGRWFIDGRYD